MDINYLQTLLEKRNSKQKKLKNERIRTKKNPTQHNLYCSNFQLRFLFDFFSIVSSLFYLILLLLSVKVATNLQQYINNTTLRKRQKSFVVYWCNIQTLGCKTKIKDEKKYKPFYCFKILLLFSWTFSYWPRFCSLSWLPLPFCCFLISFLFVLTKLYNNKSN